MDSGFFTVLKGIKLTSHKRRCSDNDFVDRVNCFYTPFLITVFTIVICAKSYIVGEPLQCWAPREFSAGWEQFAESYCFIKNTYYVAHKDELPHLKSLRKEAELQYYQWVPFVLGLQSVCFLIPSLFWKFFNWQGKLHIKPLIERCLASSLVSNGNKKATLNSVSEHMKVNLFRNRFTSHGTLRRNIKDNGGKTLFGFINSGFYLTFGYFVTKVLYIGNIVIQFLILKSFLKVEYSYGLQLMKQFANGSDWQDFGIFPRVTFCDFETQQFGQPISYTMQCVLVINLFNEKIYIFLWFWFVLIFVVTVGSLVMWTSRMLFQRRLMAFLRRTSEHNTDQNRNQELLRCESEMTTDAHFVLRIIEENCGLFITRKVVENLIGYYKDCQANNEDSSLPPDFCDTADKLNSSTSSEM